MMRVSLFCLAAALAAGPVCAQQLYRSVQPDGTVRYTDLPPTAVPSLTLPISPNESLPKDPAPLTGIPGALPWTEVPRDDPGRFTAGRQVPGTSGPTSPDAWVGVPESDEARQDEAVRRRTDPRESVRMLEHRQTGRAADDAGRISDAPIRR
jgi:hypothetical protein